MLISGEASEAARRFRAAAEMFGMLADPTRLELLMALADGPATVGGLIERLESGGFPFARASVSNHLGLIRRAEYAESRRDEQWAVYSLTPAGEALAKAVADSFLDLPIEKRLGGPVARKFADEKKAAHP
jgi:DNA-binding transcriptional ArsR family regulator